MRGEFGANAFVSTAGGPVTDDLHEGAWDGERTNGCGDELGVFGGPLTLASPLSTTPAVGPRP